MSFTSGHRVTAGRPFKADATMDVLIANAENLITRTVAAGALIVASSKSVSGAAAITFDSATYDTNSFWSAGSPTRLTVPSGFSYVRLTTWFAFTANPSAATVAAYVQKNVADMQGQGSVSIKNIRGRSICTSILQVSAADYFTFVMSLSTGSQNVDASMSIEAWA